MMILRRLFPLVLAVGLTACMNDASQSPTVAQTPPASQAAPPPADPVWAGRPASPSAQVDAPVTPPPVTAAPLDGAAAGSSAPMPPPVVISGQVKIGMLLPLSGRAAAAGQAILNAGELAVFDVAAEGFVLLPFDTEQAGAGVAAKAAVDAGVNAILGPLFAAQVPEVAAVAQAAGIPVVSFSNDRDAAGPNTYILGLSPLQGLERAISFARSKGYAEFAALVSDDALGSRVGALVQTYVPQSGGSVAKIDTYPAATSDFNQTARRAGMGAARDKTGPGYRALVISESGAKLKQMGPWLPYHNIDPAIVKLIGVPNLEDPTLGSEPGLNGAWFAAPDPAGRTVFEGKFRDTFGRVPPRIATVGYDGVALMAVIARLTNGPNFTAENLTNPTGFAGIDGLFRFLPSGAVERGLAVFEVQRGGYRLIEAAPAAFTPLVN